MNSGSTGRPTLICDGARRIQDGTAQPLVPLPLTGRDLTEDDLQELLHVHPEVVPIDAISSRWGPLVSLGREIGLAVGFVDNLFVSPAGELTVVEAKLWRNPEARREVIGQILDYAAALASMSYEELDAAVQASDSGPSIWSRVARSRHTPSLEHEGAFIDTISRNLRAGRFLLLVVGDGIRSDLHSIAGLLGRHPTLGFHLELVEMRVHAVPDTSDLLVVPSLIGRTEEVTRAVVEIHNPDRAEVTVAVEVPAEQPAPRPKLQSLEEFHARAAELVGTPRASALLDIANWWRDQRGEQVRLHRSSLSLYGRRGSGGVSVLTIYTDGEAVGSVAPMARTHGLCEVDDALAHFQAAGFSGSPDYPTLDFDPTVADQRLRVIELLNWAADVVAGNPASS
jgi:hypothetical protein